MKTLKEMKFMMERLENPRMTYTEYEKKHKKLLKESDDFEWARGGDHIFELIMDKERELEENPKYKMYEKKYLRNKLIETITSEMGIDANDLGGDELEMFVDMFSSMMDMSKNELEDKRTPENLKKHKNGIIQMVNQLIVMAKEDGESDLVSTLEEYNRILNEY
jgi:hypothetical protein